MSFTVGGSTPQLTFADATVQNTAALPLTGGSVSADITVHGLTVGQGGGSVSTNTAVGASALAGNTTGTDTTAIGYQAGYSNTTGARNTFVGEAAGYLVTTGSDNTTLGFGALASGGGSGGAAANNVAVGTSALKANTASNNTAVGYQAGYSNTTGTNNTFLGQVAGRQGNGTYNTFIGDTAGYNTSGTLNALIGQGAGYLITSGSKNTVLGSYNGNQGGLDIRTSSNYIVLSDGDGNPRAYANTDQWHLGISNGAIRMPSDGGIIYIASITSNSQFQISYNSISAGVALGSGATSWSTFSDERLKNVTGTYTNALEDIAQIQPVKFTWKNDTKNKPQVGVIAQSVQNVVPEAIDSTTYEMDGNTEYLQVRYTELIPLMIASIQELKAEFDAYKATHP